MPLLDGAVVEIRQMLDWYWRRRRWLSNPSRGCHLLRTYGGDLMSLSGERAGVGESISSGATLCHHSLAMASSLSSVIEITGGELLSRTYQAAQKAFWEQT